MVVEMPRRIYFIGLKRVQNNLNREIKKIKGRTKAGLMHAALVIRRRSQQLTPIDTGNLKGSAYTQAWQAPGGNPGAEIGYTASYAPFVHEVEASHRHPTQWKFLETAMKEKSAEVLKIIQRHAKV